MLRMVFNGFLIVSAKRLHVPSIRQTGGSEGIRIPTISISQSSDRQLVNSPKNGTFSIYLESE